MDDCDKSWLGDKYSYKNSCICNGHHLDIECPICHICGRQYIHWNGFSKFCPFPRTPVMILPLLVMLAGAMKWKMQNKRGIM